MNSILTSDIVKVMEGIQLKYSKAQLTDRHFDSNNYIWLLGKNTLDKIQACFDPYITFDSKPVTGDILMGIRIEVDTNNPDGLRLFKEVV